MKRFKFHDFLFLALPPAFLSAAAFGGSCPKELRNPPPACESPVRTCGCPNGNAVQNACVKFQADGGGALPSSGGGRVFLAALADSDSVNIFSEDHLIPFIAGPAFRRLAGGALSDGVTSEEVVMAFPDGASVRYRFANGSAVGRPVPGPHGRAATRLVMADSAGNQTLLRPFYYDLHTGDGTSYRFRAKDATDGRLGSFVSRTDAHGKTVTLADMGVDIVYGMSSIRQVLTPSRLLDIQVDGDFLGYTLSVHAVRETPEKGADGRYAVPPGEPLARFRLHAENDRWRKVEVFVKKGSGAERRWLFEYGFRDWMLTHPSGLRDSREIHVKDEWAAKLFAKKYLGGDVYASTIAEYAWMRDIGFVMTNRVEGFDGATDTTSWTYNASGNGKGYVATETRQSGLLTQYAYDGEARRVSETRSGPGMMTETTTYGYAPVDASDTALLADSRPRTVVKTLDGIECERTYYVYSPLTNIVERVGTQGAAFGGTNVLRTVTAFYPVTVGASVPTRPHEGLVSSIRHEDGKLDLYDYALVSNIWIETVTHLHEQSPEPVSGKTTRDTTETNARGETIETRTEAYIEGAWHVIARERMTYNAEGKRIASENLAGQVTTTAWDCCHKVSETQPDGSTTTWDYDADDRMIAASRLIPLDMTNVTWLTTCYEYDPLGRQTATWQTNFAAQVGLPVERTRYDQLGRVIARVDKLGNTTTMSYSNNGRVQSVTNANTSTVVYARNPNGDTLSITGTAVTPEFHSYGVLPDGTRWSKTVQGETADSPRFTKRYENLLGQTVREERSGFQGAVLATAHSYDSLGRLVSTAADCEPITEYTYDTLGNRVAVTKLVGLAVPSEPQSETNEWRKTESFSSFVIDDSVIWLIQTNIVSCSDTNIAPLVSSAARQLTGLTAALPSRSRSTDIRGNITENEMVVDSAIVTSRQTVPYATNKPLALSRYGVSLMEVSVSAVTNTVIYDSLGRQMSTTDGRGNTRQTEYNSLGQRSASIDALGNRTTYAYNQFGNLTSVTDPLGHATIYEYDLRGRKTYEGGATYPVRYTYDVFGNKTTMMTYRNESLGPNSGDVTTWRYDEASNCMTNKVYADGKGPSYSYAPNGILSRRTWARGIVTDYSYDNWGSLTNTVYSDDTPTVSLAYNALGRQTEARDAAGVTTFLYDSFGSLTNETVIGVAGTNIIDRYWDTFGRYAGYALNGARQTILAYGLTTSRLASMQIPSEQSNDPNNPNNQTIKQFSWSYHVGSDLKSSLAYPNGLTASWQYDANNQLLQVCNATATNVISQYDYTYDAAGRRVSCGKSGSAFAQNDTIAYAYNNRRELTNAVAAIDAEYRYAYDFDDIGDRETAAERGTNTTYAANSLNQYTSISNSLSTFQPVFDDDGNQTLIKTATGIWSITYNGENRPALWSCIQSNNSNNTNNQTILSMSYDRMGRRVTKNNQHFVYDGYLQIADNNGNAYVWDPTCKVATRQLAWLILTGFGEERYYTHDGNKNVSEVVSADSSIAAHYGYAPFGAVAAQYGENTLDNSWRFSCEYAEDATALVYYNYRYYNPENGRWTSSDALDDLIGAARYLFIGNKSMSFDHLGLYDEYVHYYLVLWLALQLMDSQDDANALAWGSQYPDTESWDAILNLLSSSIPKLHNLNGFGPDRVRKYRCCVSTKYKKCMDEARSIADDKSRRDKLVQCGIFLHVLGDTYAHTMSDETAYLPVIGHLADWTAPDNPQNSIVKFENFLDDILAAFPCSERREEVKRKIMELMNSWNYDYENRAWTPKQNYKDIVKALMREIYPEFDFNEMQKQLTVSNKEDDNLVKNEILPELDKCYDDSRK